MKKIIVTGCNGQLGRAVNRLYQGREDLSFVNTDVGELDITKIDSVMELAREVKPYAIINCAAHTNVDKCEAGGQAVLGRQDLKQFLGFLHVMATCL